jgi:hypothetical protein
MVLLVLAIAANLEMQKVLAICSLFRRSAAVSAILHNDESATPKQDTQEY